MSDATIQAAIQTLIRAHASFASADVSLGDFRVLTTGTPPVAIIVPGPLRARRAGDWAQVNYTWTHYIEIWARFAADDYANLVTARQNVVDQINAYPTLNGTSGVTAATATASDAPLFLWQKGQPKGTRPQFVGFRVTVETIEEVSYHGSGEFTT